MAYWEVFLEALIDSSKALPILLVVYFLIEFIEDKWANKLHNNHLLRGKASPVLGALIGSVPQCGFSVVATDLFAHGIIPIGTLLAIFVATSDEALPLLMTHPENWLAIVVLLVAKICIAIVVGYLANLTFRLLYRRSPVMTELGCRHAQQEHTEHEHADTKDTEHHHILHNGCCHHSVDEKHFDWKHPLMHSLKIWLFIFAVSFLFGCVADVWVGHDRLTAFLNANIWLQPLLAVLVGLIPNCAASVVLTEFYLVDGLCFGALLAGLCVNAGLGIIFLLRQKKLWREKFFVIGWLLTVSLLAGYGFLWLNI